MKLFFDKRSCFFHTRATFSELPSHIVPWIRDSISNNISNQDQKIIRIAGRLGNQCHDSLCITVTSEYSNIRAIINGVHCTVYTMARQIT